MALINDNVRRVIRTGFINFWRNGTVSVASVFVMVVTLFIIGALILSNAFLSATLAQIQDKVDINVYFKPDAPEEEILDLRDQVEKLSEVKLVEYVTREQALEDFRSRNEGNELIIQSLDVLDDNPLGAVLNIKAKEPSQYQGIAEFLDKESGEGVFAGQDTIIDSINYFKNEIVITRLTDIIEATRSVGFFISIVLAAMAILVTFNTIRLAIYNAREEINVMQLVGASYGYIRGPFIVGGIIYGFVAALLALGLLYPAVLWASRATVSYFLAGADGSLFLLSYYSSNFAQMFIVLTAVGAILGTISSLIAVRKHLK